jgi:hypothetical protein
LILKAIVTEANYQDGTVASWLIDGVAAQEICLEVVDLVESKRHRILKVA